ncbi:hypothetical protein O7600_21045 [Micromonospora sp. WMMA1998]|uniref:hypothetical protein n=1 Tax=Micromonospora sp. WMMA1998 TaxID=3015167 RepID=UPI00248B5BD2|nr:hypothetical protein [Micromonospora sp. WMMA1998]WBC13606.1 hypothetical protein O7600_21045 [Micromonospora sp. WMMA1998]
MQDTVAVALITSMSTLAAAGMTGVIGAWAARRQVTSHLTGAREERAEQRATERAQRRRDAYVGFLGACDQAYRSLDRNWRQESGAGHGETYQALRGLDEAYNIVLLEGPEEVAREAELVTASINGESRELWRLIGEAAAESDGVPPADVHGPQRRTAIEERARRRDSFVDAARAALEQTR